MALQGWDPSTVTVLKDKCILLISPEPWHGLRMSKHHWAEALAKRGNRVLWLDAPRSSGRGPVRITREDPVERVAYHHWLRGVNRMPESVQRWYGDRLIRQIEKKAGRSIDIVWSFDMSRLACFSKESRLSIAHPVDLFMVPPGRTHFNHADLVLTSSQPIQSAALELVPEARAICIGHGLDERWLHSRPERPARSHGRSVVCCAGNMAIPYLDWEVLATEVQAHPETDFRFIGPCTSEPQDAAYHVVRAQPNATFTGLMAKEDLMDELHRADALLLCYRADRWASQLSNPHKLLEYFATGNPIVASFTSEYAGISGDVLRMARERWEHPALLAEVLADLPAQQTFALRAARMARAQAATIGLLLDRVEEALLQQ